MNIINSTCLIILTILFFCLVGFLCPAKLEAVQPPFDYLPSEPPPLVNEDEIVKFIKTAPVIGKAFATHYEIDKQNKQIEASGWDISRFDFLSRYLFYLLYPTAQPVGQNEAYFQRLLQLKSSPSTDEKSLVNKYKLELSKAFEEIYQSGPFTEKNLLSYLEANKLITSYYKTLSENPDWRNNRQPFEISKKNGLDMIRYQAINSRLVLALVKTNSNLPAVYDAIIPGPPLTQEELKLAKKYEQQIITAWKVLEETLSPFTIVD